MGVLQRIGDVPVAAAACGILRTPAAAQSGASVCTLVSAPPVKPPPLVRLRGLQDGDGRGDELRRTG
ncbi:hypothetical protein [Actinomadura bangladeshensis]|uniref:Uncharacterized protein n=1 Tax=Actinomadura bangladeshensis TaxID=453573 RepID=A0A4R4NRF9_9ACTN|nr:hypothetical protein [Actinomadura bangladeshensis]TDC12198.1 hypothetical protein E1284_24750 [Actinomadura bangladeshensis]